MSTCHLETEAPEVALPGIRVKTKNTKPVAKTDTEVSAEKGQVDFKWVTLNQRTDSAWSNACVCVCVFVCPMPCVLVYCFSMSGVCTLLS